MSRHGDHEKKAEETHFHAVCRDCGNVRDEPFDDVRCECGGVYHIDSARCLGCAKRYPFRHVGEKCSCGGEIVPKMVSCPSCKNNATINHLGEYCPGCNVELKMEG